MNYDGCPQLRVECTELELRLPHIPAIVAGNGPRLGCIHVKDRVNALRRHRLHGQRSVMLIEVLGRWEAPDFVEAGPAEEVCRDRQWCYHSDDNPLLTSYCGEEAVAGLLFLFGLILIAANVCLETDIASSGHFGLLPIYYHLFDLRLSSLA